MRFEPAKPNPYEMYVYLGRQNYETGRLQSEPDLNPYLNLTLTGLGYAPSPWEGMGRDEKQTEGLEGLSDGLSLAKWTDPVGAFLGAKKAFLGRSITDLLGEIEVREKMRDDHTRRIDYESCSFQTRIYELDFWQRGLFPGADRVRTNLEKEMSGLEKEKRMEEIACWRDVSRLKGELRELTQEWSMEKRKDLLLGMGGPHDGSPGNL